MPKYLLALDQGTTSSRCIVFDLSGNIISIAAKEFTQIFPNDGWVEHNAEEIYTSQLSAMKEAIAKINADAKDILAIGITNQRETTVIWDKRTGKPVYNAIVWQCRRTAPYCDSLKASGLTEKVRQKTGLIIDSYFSATKIKWILDNVDGARERAERGELCFGTVDSWLIYNLTCGKVHATDHSNASRTMLFNINTLEWDKELLALFGIPENMMPEVGESSHIFGYTDKSIFGAEIPIAGVAGDQQASLFGQCCFRAGNVKNTYGTGGFMLMNTGAKPIMSQSGLLTSIGWVSDGKPTYVLEGSVFICGAAVQWLRDGIHLIEKASESEAIATSVCDAGGVYFVPAFVGLGAPYWDPYARGALLGITRATTVPHIVRAVIEAMAYQTYEVLKAIEKDLNGTILDLRVDGGASANNFLMQFQSDILGLPILRPSCIETTALGAAKLAGLAVGAYSSLYELEEQYTVERKFAPCMADGERKKKIEGWYKAVGRSLDWVQHQ